MASRHARPWSGADATRAASKECGGCRATVREGKAVVFLHGEIFHARCVPPGQGLGGIAATEPSAESPPPSDPGQ